MITLRPSGLIVNVLCLLLLQSYCFAQDKSKADLGKVTPTDFSLPANPIIDSNTNAVILADIGSVQFIGNDRSWFSYVFKKTIRIKLVNQKAMELATKSIQVYSPDDHPDRLSDITATTYNLENGQVSEVHLDKKDIFTNRLDKQYVETKFTLPGAKEGSIIEYTYTLTSDYCFNLPAWEFQSEQYPCLWSEYKVEIPQALFYVFVRQGVHGFAIDKGSEGTKNYKVTQRANQQAMLGSQDQDFFVSAVTTKHQWAMKDIPALRPERYLTTPTNYLDRIEFQLSKTYNGSEFNDVNNNWKKATEDLLERSDFGLPLQEDNQWLTDLIDKAIGDASNTTVLEQAKRMYYYVSSHFSCTNHYNKYIKTTLRDIVRKNSGTVGDINLLLIAMLRQKGWQADPVVLSTREYGYNLATYPVLGKLNYVIVRFRLGDKVWYLDAAQPQLGFGHLAGNCYNGHARIISNKDSGSVYFETDSLKEKKTTLVMLINGDKGLEGSIQMDMGELESYDLRGYIREHGQDKYFKNIQTSFGDDITISNETIDSLAQLERNARVRYEFRMNQSAGASVLYINPMLWGDFRDNPFKAQERKYPVEMPDVLDKSYVFSMEIPDGYVIDEMPKSAKVVLNGNQGSFEYIIGQVDNRIQLRCRVQLNKSWFSPEEYQDLRDFFGFVVKKENESIVLKKR